MKRRVALLTLFASIFFSFPVAGQIYFAAGASNLASLPSGSESTIPKRPPEQLRVLSYNVFLRPSAISSADYTVERAEQIGRWLKSANVDIVALQEAWEPEALSVLLAEVADELPYFVLDQPQRPFNKLVSGGLLILSRWPILETRTLVYDACHLADCLAAKGAVHALIQVSESAQVNVVATHLDAGIAARDLKVRASQLEQLRQFVAGIDHTAGPLLIAGDFNIDALAGSGEFDTLTTALGVDSYATDIPSSVNCELESSIFCEEPTPPKQIDFVFTRSGEQRLSHRETRIFPLTTDGIDGNVRYLSDHRAVLSTFGTNFD